MVGSDSREVISGSTSCDGFYCLAQIELALGMDGVCNLTMNEEILLD